MNDNSMSMRSRDEAVSLALDPNKRSTDTIDFQAALRAKIVGQEEGVHALVDLYQVFRAGLNSPGRPVGNLLFLGPTGSGKTRIVEAAAEILFGEARAVIKIDCAEFQHSHEIAKLIGSPPGYLGHRETHPLITQETLSAGHTDKLKLSFLLFDEIEKASDALWQLLLGMLDKATLTLGDNRKVDLSQTVIFLTSNLGGGEIAELMQGGMGLSAGWTKPMPPCRAHARWHGFRPAGRQTYQRPGREGGTYGGGSGTAEILTGIHEPPRQGCGIPPAAARAASGSARHRAGSGAAAGTGHRQRAVSLPGNRGRTQLPSAGRHGPALRCPASEARHRATRRLSAGQPAGYRSSQPGRLGAYRLGRESRLAHLRSRRGGSARPIRLAAGHGRRCLRCPGDGR